VELTDYPVFFIRCSKGFYVATLFTPVDFPEGGGVKCNQWKKEIFETTPGCR